MHKTQELKRKSVRGVLSYSIRTIFIYAIGLVATGLLSAYLSPADFGIYFVVTAAIGIFTFLSDVGLAASLVQKKEEPTTEEMRTTFTVQQGLALLIVALVVLLTPYWKQSIGLNQEGLYLLYALAFSFVLASLKTIPSILLERKLEFQKLVFPQVVENLVFYSVAVVLAIRGFGVMSYTYAVIARSVSGLVVIYYLQQWPFGLGLSRKALGKLLHFGVKFQANDLLARLKDDLFIVVLSRFLSAADMGYIGWAKRWSMFPYQFSVNSVIAITFPTFSRLQSDTVRLRKAIEKSLFFITIIIFPILVGMSVMARPLISLIPAYEKWLPALPSLYFFALNIAWAAVSTPLTNTLNAIGEINKTLKLMIMWTGLTWLVTPVAVYFMGMTGVAMAAAIVASTSFITILMVKQLVPFDFWANIWLQLLASLGMGGLLLLGRGLWGNSWLWLFLGVSLGAISYASLLVLFGYSKIKMEVLSLWEARR